MCYAKCKSYEGLEGIVVQERLKSFTIMTPESRALGKREINIVIMKENAVFLLPV